LVAVLVIQCVCREAEGIGQITFYMIIMSKQMEKYFIFVLEKRHANSNINWRDVQIKNVVNNVDMSS